MTAQQTERAEPLLCDAKIRTSPTQLMSFGARYVAAFSKESADSLRDVRSSGMHRPHVGDEDQPAKWTGWGGGTNCGQGYRKTCVRAQAPTAVVAACMVGPDRRQPGY